MFDEYSKLMKIIGKVRKWIRLKTLLEGSLLSFSVLLLSVMAFSILDYSLSFNPEVRLYFLISLIAFLLLLAVKYIFVPIFSPLSERKIALRIQKCYPVLRDDLINSIQLFWVACSNEEPYVSRPLIRELVRRTSKKIGIVNILEVENIKRLKKLLLVTVSVCLIFSFLGFFPPRILSFSLSRIVDPLGRQETSRLIRVNPGHTQVLYGESQKVEVEIFQGGGAPYLFYKISGSEWQKARMVGEGNREGEWRRFSYQFSKIIEPLHYFIKWKDLRTQAYIINVVLLPEVGDVSIKYVYPSYTGLPDLEVDSTSGDLEALLGTRVEISLKANKPIRRGDLLTDDGKRLPLKIERELHLQGSLVLTGERQYWIEVEDVQGYTNPSPIRHSIKTLKDSSPQVTIISPGCDLTVSEKAKVELAYEGRDDFGLSQIDLVYQKTRSETSGSTKPERIRIQRFEPSVSKRLTSYEWNLEKLRLRPGDLISYYLEVWDNDTISGPKSGVSRTYYLEVFSYIKEHEEIEQMEDHFREELLRILGDQIVAKSRMENWDEKKGLEELKGVGADQERIQKSTADLLSYLNEILPRMNVDPLGNFQAYSEYENMMENLQYLKDEKMAEALSTISETVKGTGLEREKFVEKTKTIQQEIISELEKMSLLSQDMLQNEKMRDLLETAQDLLDSQTNLTQKLEEMGQEMDKQKLEELRKSLEEISKLMAKLVNNLSQLPESLPEEFINQDAVKSLDLGKMFNDIEKMSERINKSDLEGALKMAKELLQTLSSTMATLQAASGQVPSFSNLSESPQKASSYAQELEKLIEEEKGLAERTNKLNKKRLQELFKRQELLLKELGKLQGQAIEEAKKIAEAIKGKLNYVEVYPPVYQNLLGLLRKMEEVLSELSGETPRRAKELLLESIGRLDNMLELLRNFGSKMEKDKDKLLEELSKILSQKEEDEELTAREKGLLTMKENLEGKGRDISDVEAKLGYLREKEEEIVKSLGLEQGEIFNEEEIFELEDLAQKQKELENRTRKLMQKLEELSSLTSAIGPKIISNMDKASSAMEGASEELKERKTEPALEKEREALYYLGQGKEELASASKKLKELAEKGGRPLASFLQPRGGLLPGGRMGLREGYVKIPEAHEYQPPKEFREELLEALKEKYPEIYEELIKQYYRSLTE